MSTMVEKPVTRSRWLDWTPTTPILADSAEGAPSKPSKPGSVGFVGAISAITKSAQSPEITTALANQGTDPAIMTPEQAGTFIRKELAKWKKVVDAAGVRAE